MICDPSLSEVLEVIHEQEEKLRRKSDATMGHTGPGSKDGGRLCHSLGKLRYKGLDERQRTQCKIIKTGTVLPTGLHIKGLGTFTIQEKQAKCCKCENTDPRENQGGARKQEQRPLCLQLYVKSLRKKQRDDCLSKAKSYIFKKGKLRMLFSLNFRVFSEAKLNFMTQKRKRKLIA